MILEKIKRAIRRAYATDESSYKYNGPFSYRSETHSFLWGLGLALGLVLSHQHAPALVGPIGTSLATLLVYSYSDRHERSKAAQVPAHIVKASEQEPHYLSGGVVIGLLLGGLVVLGGPVLAFWV